MITEQLRTEIRALFYGKHFTVGTIAAHLDVHHQTVRSAVEADRFVNTRERDRDRASILDPYKAFILDTLETYPRLRSTRICDMLRSHGYGGGAATVRRFVRSNRPQSDRTAYLRLTTLPGEQGQVDWACFGKIRVGRALRDLSCFVMVLSWSRAIFAQFFLDQTLESFLCGHVHAFAALGGAPRVLLYDNLKTAVLERSGDHIRFHPRLLELSGHYHTMPRPCAPYRGNEKGKVERQIQYLRHSFFAARRFHSVEDVNAQLREWIDRVAHARPVPGDPDKRPIHDAFREERECLLPLPKHPFECDAVRAVRSGKTPYVRFDLNDYTIPHTLVRKPLTLVASETTVRVLDGVAEVASHARSYDRGRTFEQPGHIEALANEKRHAHELHGRDRLRSLCSHADAFIAALAQRGVSMARHTTSLIKLLDRHGPEELDRAIADAVARGAYSADAVSHLLEQGARQRNERPPIDLTLPDDSRVRNLHVTPHALGNYDTLAERSSIVEDSDG
jgi:transposase